MLWNDEDKTLGNVYHQLLKESSHSFHSNRKKSDLERTEAEDLEVQSVALKKN